MQPELQLRSTLSDQTLQYVRMLERRILEQDSATAAAVIANCTLTSGSTTNNNSSSGASNANTSTGSSEILTGRPEAVVRALQILEVREQLERDRAGTSSISPEHMDDGEKALVQEFCNVAWRTLEEKPNGPGIDPL